MILKIRSIRMIRGAFLFILESQTQHGALA